MIHSHFAVRSFVRSAIIGLTLILFACSSGDGGSGEGSNGGSDDTPPTVQLPAAASRTSGVAPLGVFFNAALDTTTDSFHHLEYTWDFGDPSSGTWADSGATKNSDKGPVAAHIFESAGSYTVTLTVRDGNGIIATEAFAISVEAPDDRYAGTDTVCISTSSANDFSQCPVGADTVLMDDINALADHVSSGKRVLLRRGDSWTTTGSARYADISGPVTIGAYGQCQNPDARGICANAPRIHLSGDETQGLFSLYRPSDWRIMDLHISGETTRWGAIGGDTDLQSLLLLRLRVEGFNVPLGASHWNTDGHDQFMIVDCDVSGSESNEVYIGSERLVLMGNNFRNPSQSHVLRVWQAYLGVIGHNTLSGSSQESDLGRHALKFHGPGQEILANAGNGRDGLMNPTRFVVVTDNIFGGSGPWPVAVGPQDGGHDERLRDIIVEKNRFFSDYGDQSCCSSGVRVALHVWAADITVRNNIFDGTASSAYYTAIHIGQRGIETAPSGNRIYNNTIYKADLMSGYTSCRGIDIDAGATETVVRNNLVHLPSEALEGEMIRNASADLVSDHNLMTDNPGLVDPDNPDHLLKDFRLLADSAAKNQGADVPVWDGFDGTQRPQDGLYDIGAFERP
jgi:PKD repeat protein